MKAAGQGVGAGASKEAPGTAAGNETRPGTLPADTDRSAGPSTTHAAEAAAWTDRQVALLKAWKDLATAAQHAHYHLAAKLRRRNFGLGVPTVVCAAIVGTSLFATLNETGGLPTWARAAIGTLSVIAAVLAAVQTFLRFAERAERHAQAGDWYSAIRRDVEELLVLPSKDRGKPKEVLHEIRKELNKAGQTYPELGEKTWHAFAKAYGVEQPTFAAEVDS